MTGQLELFGPQDLPHDDTSACAAEISERPEIHMPLHLAEELEAAAERVRAGLNKMRATHAEMGRELWAVKKRLTRGQFMSWVGSACGLSQRTARIMMRYAGRELSTPSKSPFEQSQKLKPQVVKDVVRAVRKPKAPSSKTNVWRAIPPSGLHAERAPKLERHSGIRL